LLVSTMRFDDAVVLSQFQRQIRRLPINLAEWHATRTVQQVCAQIALHDLYGDHERNRISAALQGQHSRIPTPDDRRNLGLTFLNRILAERGDSNVLSQQHRWKNREQNGQKKLAHHHPGREYLSATAPYVCS